MNNEQPEFNCEGATTGRSREDLYLHARDALIKLNAVTKDGDEKHIAFWCGAASRRVADYIRDCLSNVAMKTTHKVITP